TPDGPRVHSGYLHHQPPEMMRDYERIKQHDVLATEVIANPGRTVSADLRRCEAWWHPDAVAHARRYGMEQTLSTVLVESELSLLTTVALYRRDPDRPFTEEERRFKQELMPHLVATWHLNAIHFVDTVRGPAYRARRARALIDGLGVIYNAEPGLPALLRLEFSGWCGPTVPASLLADILSDGSYKGGAVTASLTRRGENGTLVVTVRERAPVDRLSSRE